ENPLSESGMWSTPGSWTSMQKNNGAFTTGVNSAARLVSPAANADQYAEITYDQAPGTSNWVGVMTRIQSASNGSGYMAAAYAGTVGLYKATDTGSVAFTLVQSVTTDLSVAPRLLRLESRGSSHSVYFNGTLMFTYTDPNNSYTSGQPGIVASVWGGAASIRVLSFSGGSLTSGSGDTTPPVRTSGQPTGVLASGTTQTTLSLTTNEAATCHYAQSAGVAYASMPNTFSSTGGTSQATTVSGLQNGGTY